MSWFVTKRRGPEWKQGWTGQTLSSISAPPPPLLTIFAIVFLFLLLSRYTEYKAQMEQTMISFRFLLFLLPVLLIFIVRSMAFKHGMRFAFRQPRPEHDSIHRAGGSPWGVAALVIVLLLMISYQSSFHSNWFRPLWRSD
uniref:Uncharacterized protein n=1 Tax=Nelumbo nucifera TaxID=4432 RepID=A0A822XU93_NELNU|nr:TPA_asm: hypothetical protein HUJ06_023848 [Nelumbo nucifera]